MHLTTLQGECYKLDVTPNPLDLSAATCVGENVQDFLAPGTMDMLYMCVMS